MIDTMDDPFAAINDRYGKKAGPANAAPTDDPFAAINERHGVANEAPPDEDTTVLTKRGFKPDQIARIKKSSNYSPGTFATAEKYLSKDTLGGDMMGTKMGRAVTGAMDLGMGAAQAIEHVPAWANPLMAASKIKGLIKGTSDYDKEYIDAIAKVREQLIEENTKDATNLPVVGDPFRLGGAMAVPLPGGPALKGAGLLKSLAMGAVRGGAVSTIMPNPNVEYTGQGESNYGSQKAGDVLLGSTIGMGGALAGKGLERLLAKKIPGTPIKDVSTLGEDLTAKLKGAAAEDIDALEYIVSQGGSRSRAAAGLIEEIKANGADAPNLVQISAKVKRLTEQRANDAAFADVTEKMQGINEVPVARTVNAIDNTVAEMKKNPVPGFEPAIKLLREFKDNLLPKTKSVTTGLLDAHGDPIMQDITTKPDLSYQALAEARSTLKRRLRAIYNSDPTGGEGANGIDSRQYQRIADALSEDLSAAAQKVPGAAEADLAANSAYRNFKQKWTRNNVNKNMTSSQTPDEILKTYVGGSAKEDRAANAKAAMTQTGIEGTKAQMLESAQNASGGDPTKFTQEMKKLQDATGIFFEGEDLARLEGLKKVMKTSSQAGKVTVSGIGALVGGAAAGPIGAIGGALAAPGLAPRGHVPAEGISQVVKRLLLTKAGQKILLSANQYEPRSPQWESAIRAGSDKLYQAGGVFAASGRKPVQVVEEND